MRLTCGTLPESEKDSLGGKKPHLLSLKKVTHQSSQENWYELGETGGNAWLFATR